MDSVRIITQAYSQAPWRRQLAWVVLFLLCVIFVALVAGIYLDVTARAATIGREIQFMEIDIEKLKLENADLDTQLAYLTSSQVMQQRARDLGFRPVEQEKLLYIVVSGYQSRHQLRLAPQPSTVKTIAASLPAVYTESLFDWFLNDVWPQVKAALEVRR